MSFARVSIRLNAQMHDNSITMSRCELLAIIFTDCCVLCNCCKDNTSQDGQRSEEDDEEKREKFRKKCEDSGLVWTEQNCQVNSYCCCAECR